MNRAMSDLHVPILAILVPSSLSQTAILIAMASNLLAVHTRIKRSPHERWGSTPRSCRPQSMRVVTDIELFKMIDMISECFSSLILKTELCR